MLTRIILFTTAAIAALASPAAAGDPIAVEAYLGGERPPDADELLNPLHDALKQRGFVVRRQLVDAVERAVSRGTVDLTAGATLEAARRVDRGYEHFIQGEYGEAAAEMEQAIAIYEQAPGQMSREATLRDRHFMALVVLARSYDVIGLKEDAFRVMSTVVRFFRDRPVTTREYDPRVVELFRKVKSALAQQGTGTLEIRVDDPTALVHVDHVPVGTGPVVRVEGLLAGPHTLHMAKGDRPGRARTVQVVPRETTVVSVSWQLEGMLISGRDHVALCLAATAEPRDEVAAATRLGRALHAKSVILVSIREIDGKRSVTGLAIQIESQTRTFAAVQVEPIAPAASTLSNLGALLAGDKRVNRSGIITREVDLTPRSAMAKTGDPWFRDRWGWGLSGTGAVVAGVAVGLFVSAGQLGNKAAGEFVERDRHDLRERADRRVIMGSIVGAVGAGLLVSGVVKLVRTDHNVEHEDRRQARTRLVFGGHWVGLEWSF